MPAPKPDKGALRQASRVRRTFLALRSRLQAWAELRRRGVAPTLAAHEVRDLSGLGWTPQGSGASPGGGGGSPSGGPVQNTGPPTATGAPGSRFVPSARSVAFGAVMASFAGCIPRPRFHRFGYAEKAEYWAVVWGTVIMGATGFLIRFKEIATQFMPRWVVDIAITVHLYEAILATLSIVVWHFYAIFFDPDVYPINWAWMDGRVSKEHYEEEDPQDKDYEEIGHDKRD